MMTFISRGNESPPAVEFNQLALGLFGFQFTQNEAYANLCQSEKRTPDTVTRWEEIPAVPTRAFKSFDITVLPGIGTCFPPAEPPIRTEAGIITIRPLFRYRYRCGVGSMST